MADAFTSQDTQLSEILSALDRGDIQLPDFQRGWVWDDYRIRALIASILNGYPVGALMFLEYGGDSVRFKYRPFTGSDADCVPAILVLDGQQRLTSIYNALFCKTAVPTKTDKGKAIDRYYYLDIKKFMDTQGDTVDAVLSIPFDRKVKSNFNRDIDLDLSNETKEFIELAFPLNYAFDSAETLKWINGCKAYHKYENLEIQQLLDSFNLRMMTGVQGYRVPVIKLARDVPKGAVCQVFENVNTGGVALTVFELVTATFAADDYDLRDDWEGSARGKAIGRYERLKSVSSILESVSATDFLTSVTLLSRYFEAKNGGRAVSCKKKDVLALALKDYREHADALEQGFVNAAHFLKEQRIFTARDLPYSTQLIPLATLFAILGTRTQDSPVREKLARWYWCGVLGEMYGGANETRYSTDVVGVSKWIEGEGEPDTVTRAYFEPTRLLSLQTRLSAAYKGIMALILKNGAVDFISGTPMDYVNFTDQGVDIHHVFPRAYCENKGLSKRKWNSIVNKTPLYASTNRIIGGSAPSVYMAKIEKDDHVTEGSLYKHIETHDINPAFMAVDDFDGFFLARARALILIISEAMGKPALNLSGEEIVAEFGGTLNPDEEQPKSDFGLKDEVIAFIQDAARTCGMDEVLLFGSRATGRYSEKSDIDLAVSGSRLHDFEGALEERCPTLLEFDIIDLSKDIGEELRCRIAEEGVVLYG